MKNHRKNFGIYIIIVIFIFFILIALEMTDRGGADPAFGYGDLIAAINGGYVSELIIDRDSNVGNAGTAHAVMRESFTSANDTVIPAGARSRGVAIPDTNAFMTLVHDALTAYGIEPMDAATSLPGVSIWSMIFPFLLILIPVVVIIFLIHQMQGGGAGGGGGGGNRVMSFGKTRARQVVDEKRKVTFHNVAGLEEEKADLAEIVEFLKHPKKFVEIGARIPKGVLLVGPPGTGKTLLARAVAGEAGVPFFSISGSDFVEMFVGVGASRVRDLFDQAKKSAPCIVFIDEIDAVGRRRGAGLGGGHDEREQTLNQLLVEMDGFGANEGIIILAATNRPDILDPALLRPGRFDRRVVVGRPDVKGREEILGVHSKGKKLAPDVDLGALAHLTSGFTGADLENLLNEAALLAARDDKKELDMSDIRRAFVKVAVGTEKKSRVVNKKDKRITAYHEAGHGIIEEVLEELDPVHSISIIPTGMAAGYMMPQPVEDKGHRTKRRMEQEIVCLLGGRAAEFLVIKDITTGASNDIERATAIARDMVTRYGMSEAVGPIQFGTDNNEVFLGRDIAQSRNYGEDVASLIDQEIKRFINEAYNLALDILQRYSDTMHKTAKLLIEKEKITGDEFRALFDIPPPKKSGLLDDVDDIFFDDNPLMDLGGSRGGI